MAANQICPECGAELSTSAVLGLCPRCLIAMGLNLSDAGPSSRAGPVPTEPAIHASGIVDRKIRYFGDYELLNEIARGGMGIVYQARQVSLNRIVAVKVLLFGQFASNEFIKRFRGEAEAAASLQHPNIVAIHEVGEHEGLHYFSMDYVEGKNLEELVCDGPLPAKRAVGYVKSIAEVVHYAHQHGVLHRDLKPSNVLVDGLDEVRITDFGLAKRLKAGSQLTVSGQVLGSPNYMPPEQADSKHGAVGTYSDVYSLGAILYHLITGYPPFRGATPLETLRQALEAEVKSPRTLNPKIDEDLEAICLRCLQKEPKRRYGSAEALAEDLQRWQARTPILARPVGALEKVWRWCLRQPALATLIAVVAVLLVIVAAGSSWMLVREKQRHANEVKLRLEAQAHQQKAQAEAAKSEKVAQFLKKTLQLLPSLHDLGTNTSAAQKILSQISEQIAQDFTNQPEVEAELRVTFANVYHLMGFYQPMEAMARETLRVSRASLGQENQTVATALSLLGDALMHLARFSDAEAAGRDSLAMQKRISGEKSAALVGPFNLLGVVFQRSGRLYDAEQMFFQALDIQRAQSDEMGLEVTGLIENVALVRCEQNRFWEAEALSRRVLESRQAALGDEHEDIATSFHNLARALYGEGRLNEAQMMCNKALSMRRKLLSEEHPSVATSLDLSGRILGAQGRNDEAETSLREALALREKHYTYEHPAVAETLEGLAGAWSAQGRLEDAEKGLKDALALRLKLLGQNHPYFASNLRNLIDVLGREGKIEKAEKLLCDVLERENRLPTTALLQVAADFFARRGMWEMAATIAATAFEQEPADLLNFDVLPLLALAAGDTTGYRQYCERIVGQFGETPDLLAAERLVRACLALPESGVNKTIVSNCAVAVVKAADGNHFHQRFYFLKGLADFRQNNFAEATRWLNKSLETDGEAANEINELQARLLLAMAQQRLNQTSQGRVALAESIQSVEAKLPRPESGDLGAGWRDWILTHSLLNEARLLIKVGEKE